MKTSVAHVERALSRDEVSISFPEGIIGFAEYKEYAIDPEHSKEPFFWMQAAKNAELSFIIIDPKEFKPDYAPRITEAEKAALKVRSTDECQCYTIVAVPNGSDQISANLLAPIFINQKENIGKQVILQEQDYSVQYLILDEMLKQLEEKDVSSLAKTK
jgi:flagellar assembly factor FliW